MDRWQDRDWEPDAEEELSIGNLRQGNPGQVLLRMIDREQGLKADQCMIADPAPNNHIEIQEVASYRGYFQALQIVKNWLLAERDPETDSQEIDNG